MPARLYHGTCSGFAEAVQRHGLRASDTKPKGGTVHAIVVFEVDVARLDARLLQPDDYDLQDAVQGGEIAGSEPIDPRLADYTRWDQVPWSLSLAVTRQVFYAGSIPPQALARIAG